MKYLSLAVIDGLGKETKLYFEIIERILKQNPFLNINDVCYITADTECKNKNYNIKYIETLNYSQFNQFLFKELGDFCVNENIMYIQTDGFPINPHLWNPEFLNYDYIGAPWPSNCLWCKSKPKVGNGGFSLRTKTLYEQTKKVNNFKMFADRGTNEDVFICHILEEFLLQNGIKMAPVELAKQFSMESPIDDKHTLNSVYGFHGNWLVSQINTEK